MKISNAKILKSTAVRLEDISLAPSRLAPLNIAGLRLAIGSSCPSSLLPQLIISPLLLIAEL